MSVGEFIRNLFGADEETSGRQRVPRGSKADEPARDDDADMLIRRLGRLLGEKRSVLSGNIHLVGLARIKEKIGDEWPRIAERAHDISHRAIQRVCGADDVFTRHDELAYLIIFSNLTAEQAQIRCHEIAEEIGRKLLGENFVAEAAEVSTGVFEADGSLVFNAISKQDLVNRLVNSQTHVASPAEQGREAQVEAEPDFSFARIDKQKALESMRVAYTPMWNVRRKVLANYFSTVSATNVFGKRIWDDALRREYAGIFTTGEFDIIVARMALRDFSTSLSQGNRALFAWPVHFETLAARSSRSTYIDLCRSIPDPVRELLIFELDGLPEGAPQSRVVDVMSALKPFCRQLIIRVPAEFKNFGQMSGIGLGGIGFRLPGFGVSDEHCIRLMDEFVEGASKVGLRTYAHGVVSKAQALAAVGAGFEWIDGEAVEAPASLPGKMVRFNIDDMYRRSDRV